MAEKGKTILGMIKKVVWNKLNHLTLKSNYPTATRKRPKKYMTMKKQTESVDFKLINSKIESIAILKTKAFPEIA